MYLFSFHVTKEILNEIAIKGNSLFRIKCTKVCGNANKSEMTVIPV